VSSGAEGWAPDATLDLCDDGAVQDAVAAIKSIQGKYTETKPESRSARGWIGVRIQKVTDDIAEALNISPGRGALIASIDNNGPAKASGIEARRLSVTNAKRRGTPVAAASLGSRAPP
jgi:S1-C subfamily serine protease